MLVGPKTRAYIGGHSKAQKLAERASGGSEMNGISAGVSTFFRFDDMWHSVAPDAPRTGVGCDSSVAIATVRKGYSKAMYHLGKHAGTDIAFLHDVFFPVDGRSCLELMKVASAENFADCNTKPLPYTVFVDAMKQLGVCKLPKGMGSGQKVKK